MFAATGDVTSETEVAAFGRAVCERFGRADVLVNNAGISFIAPAEGTTSEQWRRVLEVNLTGPFLLCREVGRRMLEAGSGSIVNFASIAGIRGVADRAAYNASKHGLIGLTRTLAVEWGGRGVRVNAVCPGWAETEMDTADQLGAAMWMPTSSGRCRWAALRHPTTLRPRSPSSPTRIAAGSSTAQPSPSMGVGTRTRVGLV